MKKAIVKDIGVIEVIDAPAPELKDGEALIEMKACGICHSDICPYIGLNLDLFNLPVVMGHEFGGFIRKIKGETNEFKVGDKVTVCPIIGCGTCYYCKQGLDQLCIGSGGDVQISNFGTQAREGAFAEMVAAPFTNIVKLPDDFDMELTGIIEPTAVAYNNTKGVKDSTVIIIGVGTIGALAIKLLKFYNNKVIVIGNTEGPLKLAEKLGADFTISVKDEKKDEKIKDYLKGEFVDYVYLYFTNDENLLFATDIIRKDGEIKFIALGTEQFVKLDSYAMLVKSIKLTGYMAYPISDFRETVKLVVENEKELNLKELISAKFPLEKTKEAFECKAKEHVAKVIIIN